MIQDFCMNQDFYNLFTVPWTVSNIYTQVVRVQIMCDTLSTYHRQYVMYHMVWGDRWAIKFNIVQIACISLILLAETIY